MSLEAPREDTWFNIMAWLQLHLKHLLAGVVAVVLLMAAFLVWRYFGHQRELSASRALFELGTQGDAAANRTAADYLRVADRFPATSAGREARLLAAGAAFDAGQYAEAQRLFEAVLAASPEGPLAAQAAFGIAAALDAQDQVDAAEARYRQVAASFAGTGVAGQAQLALARLAQARQQPEQALRIYDELTGAAESGMWSFEARERRTALLRAHPSLAGTNAP